MATNAEGNEHALQTTLECLSRGNHHGRRRGLAVGRIRAPVFAPFDKTQFAPITRSGALITLEPVAKGLISPVKGVAAPGDAQHLYIVDQPGKIWRVNVGPGATLPADVATPAGQVPFLDVSGYLVTLGALGPNTFDERGLLGLAFHPQYQRNGLLYTFMSVPNAGPATLPSTMPAGIAPEHQSVVVEWRNQGGVVSSPRVLMRIDKPQFNHNGGRHRVRAGQHALRCAGRRRRRGRP